MATNKPIQEGSLEELGYGVVKTPAPSETPSTPKEGTLGELGYETLVPREQVRQDLQQDIDEHLRYKGGPILTPAQPVPSSVVTEERTRRVLRNRYGDKFREEEAYSNLPLVFDMSWSDKFSEKRAKFKDAFPKGDMKQERIGNQKITLVRETPDDPYQVYDDTVLADLAHPGTVGGIAGALSAGPLGMGMMGAAGLTGVGTFVGEMGLYGSEYLRGYQHTPLDEGMASAALMSGTASAIDLATMGGGRALRIAKPSTKISEGTKTLATAERVAERYGLERPMRGQVSEIPFIPQIFRQAAATHQKVGRGMNKQERKVLETMRRMTSTDFASASDERLHKMMEIQRKELEDMFSGKVPEGGSPEQLGETTIEALERYKEISWRAKERLYRKARKEGDTLTFDINDTQDVADKYLRGRKTKTRTGGERSVGPQLSDRLKGLLEDVKNTQSNVRTFTDSEGVKQESVEQIKGLRTEFYNLMTEGDGIERRVATEMWHTLRQSMENPTSGKASARDLLKRANKANAVREANLEIGSIHKALNNYKEEPGRILQYFRPRNQNTVRTIKNLAGKKWEGIRDEFMATMTADPASGLTWLNSLKKDKGTLRQIMSEGEEKALRKYLQEAKKLDSSKLAKVSESQLNRAHRVRELAGEGQERLQEVIRISGGRGSQFAEDARRGLMREAMDKATTVSSDGEQVIHSQTMINEINKILKSDDYAPLFTKSFKKDMEDLLVYLSKIRRSTDDFGSSIVVGGEAASARKFFLDFRQALASGGIAIANIFTGNALMRPRAFKSILESEGLMDERTLRVLAQEMTRLNESADEATVEEESAMYDIYRSYRDKMAPRSNNRSQGGGG